MQRFSLNDFFLFRLVLNGADVHPGANFVETTQKGGIKTKKFLRFGDKKKVRN